MTPKNGEKFLDNAYIFPVLLLFISISYIFNVLYWASLSSVWLHTDGHIHFKRVLCFQAAFFHSDDFTSIVPIIGYGPFLYLFAAFFFEIFGNSYLIYVLSQGLIGALGGIGIYFIVKQLSGKSSGLLGALVFLNLPIVLVHTWDGMLDFPTAALSMLALGALFQSFWLNDLRYSILAGISCGLAILTRWPGVFGIGPAVILFTIISLRKQGTSWKTIFSFSLIIIPVILLLAFLWKSVSPGHYMIIFSILSCILLAITAFFSAKKARNDKKSRVVFNILTMFLIMGAILVPWILLASSGYEIGVKIQLDMERGYNKIGQNPFDIGFLGKIRSVIRVWRFWELGPILFPLFIMGFVFSIVKQRFRMYASILLLYLISNTILIIVAKHNPAERFLFSGLATLIPLTITFISVLPSSLRMILFFLLSLSSVYQGFGWLIPGMPGAVSPDNWRKDVTVYAEPARSFFSMSWANSKIPFFTLKPFKDMPLTTLANEIYEVFGNREVCGVWIIDPEIRETFDYTQCIPQLSSQLFTLGAPFSAEDQLDRPDAEIWKYDLWLVLEKTGNDLTQLLIKRLKESMELDYKCIENFHEATMTFIFRLKPLNLGSCMERFPEYPLSPLGQGFFDAKQKGVFLPEILLDLDSETKNYDSIN